MWTRLKVRPLPLLVVVVVVVVELRRLWLIVCSAMPERAMREPQRLLPPGADPQRRRADDEFLQVCGVCYGVAGELITQPAPFSPPLSLERKGCVSLVDAARCHDRSYYLPASTGFI